MAFCSQCGVQLQPHAAFCHQCGKPVFFRPLSTNRSRTGVYIIWAIIILLLIAFLAHRVQREKLHPLVSSAVSSAPESLLAQ